jgi:hypothetical protein
LIRRAPSLHLHCVGTAAAVEVLSEMSPPATFTANVTKASRTQPAASVCPNLAGAACVKKKLIGVPRKPQAARTPLSSVDLSECAICMQREFGTTVIPGAHSSMKW